MTTNRQSRQCGCQRQTELPVSAGINQKPSNPQVQTLTNSECTIPFGQTEVTERNSTNGEHCADGRSRDLRAKRNLRLARAESGCTRPTAGTRLASNTLRALAGRRFRSTLTRLAEWCIALGNEKGKDGRRPDQIRPRHYSPRRPSFPLVRPAGAAPFRLARMR